MGIFCPLPMGPMERSASFCALFHTVPACLSVCFMGIETVFLAWFPWDAKAPLLMGARAWAGSSLGSKVLVQQ